MENIPAIWELVAWCWGSLAEERERTRTGENKPDFMGNWKKNLENIFSFGCSTSNKISPYLCRTIPNGGKVLQLTTSRNQKKPRAERGDVLGIGTVTFS